MRPVYYTEFWPDYCPDGTVCLSTEEALGMDIDPQGYCAPSDCEGLDSSATRCADVGPDGGTCISFPNDAQICIPAGTTPAGGQCQNPDPERTLMQPHPCEPGLLCLDGTCETVCRLESEDCAPPAQCVAALPDDEEYGRCFRTCEPLSLAQCGPGAGCFPLSSGQWVCQPAGELQDGEQCTQLHECQEGSACVSGLCMRMCRPDTRRGMAVRDDRAVRWK